MTPAVSEGTAKPLNELFRDFKATPAEYLSLARQIEASQPHHSELKLLRIAFAATFTADLLKPYIVTESAARGILAGLYFAPFNQLEPQLLNESSDLYRSAPDVICIAARLEELAPDFVNRFLSYSSDQIQNSIDEMAARMRNLIAAARRNSKASILIFNFAPPRFLSAGLADPSLDLPQADLVQKCNERLAGISREFADVHLFDFARFMVESGTSNSDNKLWYMARVPFNAPAQIQLGKRIARYLRALVFPPCKCLVVDLDNTLWGGVVGEDGLGGIQLGEDYPGRIYKDFQRSLLALRDRGVMLAIASKNNRSDAEDVFKNHEDMILKLEDFSAFQIHWEDKAKSLRAIAHELNIGIDALAFFDDNPVEREWIRSQVPQVKIVEAPQNPLEYSRALEDCGYFDTLSISNEDRRRADLYIVERKREAIKQETVSLDDFIRQLEIKITFGLVDQETLPRVVQLMAKTNQFNLTTRRYNAAQLEQVRGIKTIKTWYRVSDRYGDYGLVGAAILVLDKPKEWRIDEFLLSCRVLGRGVENAMLGHLAKLVRTDETTLTDRGEGYKLIGEYISTAKNSLAANFFRDNGFEQLNDGRWCLDVSNESIAVSPHIQLERKS